jgi:mono/diheme cytochrome c family protein
MAERAIDLGSPAYADSADPAAVRRIVAEGRGRMKGYAETLSGEEMDAVSHYVLEMGTARSRPEAP